MVVVVMVTTVVARGLVPATDGLGWRAATAFSSRFPVSVFGLESHLQRVPNHRRVAGGGPG